MPIPSVKRPPPPRRAPPAVTVVQEVSVGTYTTTHLELQLGGVALTSNRLIQLKDSVADLQVALATADDLVQRVKTTPTLLGSNPGDSTRGGVDIQSLEFAAVTRAKLYDQEQQQDAHYAALRESDKVDKEVRRASSDPALRRCREEVECLLATSSLPGARRPPAGSRRSSQPLPPEQQQALLNPYSTVRRQSKSSALQASSSTDSRNPSTTNGPFHLSTPSSSVYGSSTRPSAAPGVVSAPPDSNNTSLSTTSTAAAPGSLVSAPPPSAAPAMPSPPPVPQYGSVSPQAAYPPAAAYPPPVSAYPPTMRPMVVAGGQQPPYRGAGYYGASPTPVQQPYGQYPPTQMQQSHNRPAYTAL